MRYLRLSQTQPTPEANKQLRDKRLLTTRRGCHRQLVHWVPLWSGDFRSEPETGGDDEAFVPGTIEIAADREHAVLTLETDGGP
ncbi:hypothetical protein [Enhygromyxa salina]|uniref:Uncharacterized protein n=1 Tax=Enhygromyxa salina TaxID=215803 RepID=A0A2S9Y5U6_9BACT|nr:hypothetical protein [Enhygromyxa salina]PRQ00468.1 hypothetical protein ENSA7_59620 [Enhygromyxa salina]